MIIAFSVFSLTRQLVFRSNIRRLILADQQSKNDSNSSNGVSLEGGNTSAIFLGSGTKLSMGNFCYQIPDFLSQSF